MIIFKTEGSVFEQIAFGVPTVLTWTPWTSTFRAISRLNFLAEYSEEHMNLKKQIMLKLIGSEKTIVIDNFVMPVKRCIEMKDRHM